VTHKILAIDVETSPALSYHWGMRNQDFGLEQIKEPPRMLCFAARWQNQKRCMFYSEWTTGHEEMVRALYRLLDKADTVLHYNGATFDLPWCRTEIINTVGYPPSPVAQIDLWQQTRQFRLISHKFEHVLTHLLKIEGKMAHTGFRLWRDVLDGDEKAQRLMRLYNMRDVDALWDAYDPLLPWLKLPNANLFVKTDDSPPVCPNCGRSTLRRRGVVRTQMSTFHRLWCNPEIGGCGKWSRENKRIDGATVVGVSA